MLYYYENQRRSFYFFSPLIFHFKFFTAEPIYLVLLVSLYRQSFQDKQMIPETWQILNFMKLYLN